MAVFTPLSAVEAGELVKEFDIGDFVSIEPIHEGIENTNYYLTTTDGRWVITIFERLKPEQLPFYLKFTEHLAAKGCSVAGTIRSRKDNLFETVKGKPYAIANRLEGEDVVEMGLAECRSIGKIVAEMHLAAQDYPEFQKNLRDLDWVEQAAPQIYPFLTDTQRALLSDEITHQREVQQKEAYRALTVTACHCDLFRNNTLIADAHTENAHVAGVFDFYFAGYAPWLFDLAVVMNDWCIDLQTGVFKKEHAQALIDAYDKVRPLTETERTLWRDMLRAAALRFWTSRLYDYYLPRQASLITPRDPTQYERILKNRLTCELPWPRRTL